MIASENFVSKSVLEANGSILTNKYSEGYPGSRYYGGTEWIDKNEKLCMKRALDTFDLDVNTWGVNVQPLSGSPANFAVYNALLKPHDRIMGLSLASGGHLTHGFMTPKGKRISATSKYWESMSYDINSHTGFIDYNQLEILAKSFLPKIIIAGFSAYPRHYDYERMRKICDSTGSLLMSDMSHISGLVAAKLSPDPFVYSDVVTSTTHKTLRGPRSGIIWFRKNMGKKINSSVFPGLQGGPHNHTIAAVSTALHEASTQEFKEYQMQILKNSKALANELIINGFNLVTGGTDNHMILVDVMKSHNVNGEYVEKILEKCSITVNKNTIPGDTNPLRPSGIRIGTPALTTRGFVEEDFKTVAQLLSRGILIASQLNCNSNDVQILKDEVEEFAKSFPMHSHLNDYYKNV